MDEKLNDAYASLQAAHEAGNSEDATKLADYIDTLKAQQAPEQTSQPTTGAVLPAIGGVVGGVAGTGIAGTSKGMELIRALDKFSNPQQQTKTGYNPRGSSVEESIANRGMYFDAQHEQDKRIRRNTDLAKKYPGYTRPPLPHLQPTIPTTAENMLSHAANIGAMKPVTGLTMGANAIDLAQQLNAGNPVQSTVSGLGLIGGAAPYIKKLPPKLRGIGAAASMAAPVINRALDQFTNPIEQQATGGLVHLAGGGQPESKLKKIAKHIPMPQTGSLALNLALGASDIGESHRDLQSNLQHGNYGSAANNAADLLSSVSPYFLVPSIYQGGRELSNMAAGQLAYNPQQRQQMQDMSSTPMGGAMAGDAGLASQIMGQHEFEEDPGEYGHLLRNSKLPGHAAGGKIIEAGADVAKKLFAPRETKFVKLSEALGEHEGKKLGLTQTDNFGVHDGRMGGNQFPNFQNTSPLHAQDRVVWMNDSEKHAQDMINRGGLDTIWSTYIGAPDQLKSNKSVFNDILQQHYNRELTPEQVDLVNNRIATVTDSKKRLIFPQPFDIRDKFAATELGGDTFARRAAMADLLGAGEGVGKTRGGIALPEYQDILRSHRDPLTEGVPTSSVGTRLFTVDPNTPTKFSQEYHPDYNWTVHGEDQGVQFAPVPQNLAVPDWYNEINARAPGKTHGNAWFSYMKDPQTITEEYLTNLQKSGYKKGGKTKKKKK